RSAGAKPLHTLWRLHFDLERVDPSARWSEPCPSHHGVDRARWTFDHELDATVVQVARPAGDVQTRGLALSAGAKEHALQMTTHEYTPPDQITARHRHHPTTVAARPPRPFGATTVVENTTVVAPERMQSGIRARKFGRRHTSVSQRQG